MRRVGLGMVVVMIVGLCTGCIPVWNASFPSDVGTGGNWLQSVSCTTPISCVAVGYHESPSGLQTLVENYDGTSWTVTPSSNPGKNTNLFNGVSCTSDSWCVAVGESYTAADNGHNEALVETYDGTRWTVAPSPSVEGVLSSVSCTGPSWCVAVGVPSLAPNVSFTETYDGHHWSTSTAGPGDISGVSCAGPNSCVAVGTDYSSNSPQAIVDTFDGRGWTPSSMGPPGGSSGLSSVSCSSTTSCVAVGSFSESGQGGVATLVDTYNGSDWTDTWSPVASGTAVMDGVSCVNASFCASIGTFNAGVAGATTQPLIQTYDGPGGWNTAFNPDLNGDQAVLHGVSCADAYSCVIVGGYFPDSNGPGKALAITGGNSTPPFSVTTSSLPTATVGTSYSATLTAINGATPYIWTVDSGSLPPGLSLSPSGTISGKPTTVGTADFIVTVTEATVPPVYTIADLSISVVAS